MKLYIQKEANKKCEGGGIPVTIHSNVTGSVMFMKYPVLPLLAAYISH